MVNISNVRSVLRRLSSSDTGLESVDVDDPLAVVAVVSWEERPLCYRLSILLGYRNGVPYPREILPPSGELASLSDAG